MKKFIKNNWLIIIILLLVILFISKPTIEFVKNHPDLEITSKHEVEYCKKFIKTDFSEFTQNYCKKVIKAGVVKVDFYTMLTSLLFDIYILSGMAFFIIVIPTLVPLVKILKTNHIEYYLTRDSYKNFIKKFLKVSYRYVWVLPFITTLIMFLCVHFTSTGYKYSLLYGTGMWETDLIKHPYIFIFLYIFNTFIHSFTYINISLLAIRKVHTYIKGLILSSVLFISIELFLEIVVTYISKTHNATLFNIMDIYSFNINVGLIKYFAVSITMLLLSFISIYFAYRNKEKLVLDCEKNK